MNAFLYIALALLIGLLSTRLMKRLKLPNVTGYLITGIIIGPCVLGLFFNNFDFQNSFNNKSSIYEIVDKLGFMSAIALSFIAFTIGSNFKFNSIKQLGKRVIIVTIFEALGAALFVFLGLMIAHFIEVAVKGSGNEVITWPLILTLSAISCATAPAATLLIIKQYKARGALVNTLLPVVALDDAIALIAFSVLFGIAKMLYKGESVNIAVMIFTPIIEIVLSIVLGAIFGIIISFLCKFFKSRTNKVILCMFAIFANVGIYYAFKSFSWGALGNIELSYLLGSMVSCAIFVNFYKDSNDTLNRLDIITPVIFMLFFILSGANLNLTIFASKEVGILLIIALVYILFRVLGKYLGSYFGTSITKCEPEVKKYLGLTLIPQAGVAIGLATTAGESLGGTSMGALIVASILISTIVYELTGPVISKVALERAGDIKQD